MIIRSEQKCSYITSTYLLTRACCRHLTSNQNSWYTLCILSFPSSFCFYISLLYWNMSCKYSTSAYPRNVASQPHNFFESKSIIEKDNNFLYRLVLILDYLYTSLPPLQRFLSQDHSFSLALETEASYCIATVSTLLLIITVFSDNCVILFMKPVLMFWVFDFYLSKYFSSE